MSTKILVIQNEQISPPGIVGEQLKESGADVHICTPLEENGSIPFERFDEFSGLVVLGGTMSAFSDKEYPKLPNVIKAIQQFHQAEKPILGICLGAQLLARALGEHYKSNNGWEIGFSPLTTTAAAADDPIFHDIGPQVELFEFHQDNFDLPKGSCLLMTGKECHNQAYRSGAASYGFQFHPEVTAEQIHEIIEHFSKRDLKKMGADVSAKVEHLASTMDTYTAASENFAREITKRWLHLAAA